MLARRALLAGFAALAVPAIGASYAFAIEPGWRLRVLHRRMHPPGWPQDRTLSVMLIADLHAGGPHMPFARVEAILDRAMRESPDMILLLGDLTAGGGLTGAPGLAEGVVARLRALRAPLGVHAVLGNHDWWEDVALQERGAGQPRLRRMLESAGIGVLHNAAMKVGGVWLAGLGSLWAFRAPGKPYRSMADLPAALDQLTDDDPVLLLCHEPDIFPAVPPRVSLTLSGHTHGGQVRLFGYSPVVPSRHGNRYAYGHVVEEGRHLLVSGGLGTSILPVRFGVPPEITLLTLGEA